jgi:hypothetical protein
VSDSPTFYTHTNLALGLRTLFEQLGERLALKVPLNVYLAGGMAVHLYTAIRVTTDVDAEFGGRIYLPTDLLVEVTLEDGTEHVIYLDTNYNPTFALLHEDYLDDALLVDFDIANFRIYVLAPVDLAVSKIARLADNDKEDIYALVKLGLTTAAEIKERAEQALVGYVGGQEMLLPNLQDAIAIANVAQSADDAEVANGNSKHES